MEISETDIAGVRIVVPRRRDDARGVFAETWRRDLLEAAGIAGDFVQENDVVSGPRGTVRGLHFQAPPHAQAKLVRVVRGAVLDVAVDLRRGSPTQGRHVAVELSAANWRQIYVPVGFAHGYCTLEPETHVVYKVSARWAPGHEHGVHWRDPALGIDWPVDADEAHVNERDRGLPRLETLPVVFD